MVNTTAVATMVYTLFIFHPSPLFDNYSQIEKLDESTNTCMFSPDESTGGYCDLAKIVQAMRARFG